MSKGKLVVISGASGVGKGTVLGIMMKKREDLKFSVSATTRSPRPSETDGVHYYFVTKEQFEEFVSLFDMNDEKLNDLLAEWIVTVRRNFETFVPKHLHSQINQWVSGYLHQIIGYVIDELIVRGVLNKPDSEKPLTDGVFSVEGKYINP